MGAPSRRTAGDLTSVVRAVETALPEAQPFAVARLLSAQVPHVDVSLARKVVDTIVTRVPASIVELGDEVLDGWPGPVAQHVLACVRALPPGTLRLLALCNVARRLEVGERREVLDGLLDGTLPELSWDGAKPLSHSGEIDDLVRMLPEEWREEWIAKKAKDVFSETRARRAVGSLTEGALRRMWSTIDHDSKPPTEIPRDYFGTAHHLPPDLRTVALARIRACATRSTRLFQLNPFDDELTDAERYEVVETPWNDNTRNQPRSQADHLRSVRHHLPKVPLELRQRWLRTVLGFVEDDDLQMGLFALEPSLSGADRQEARDALVASVLRHGRFIVSRGPWNLLPDAAVGPLLLRLREEDLGWSRDELIAHLIDARAPDLADACLLPLVEELDELGADHRLEIVGAMTPWLARQSGGAVPRAIAELPVPVSPLQATRDYRIQRSLRSTLRSLGEE